MLSKLLRPTSQLYKKTGLSTPSSNHKPFHRTFSATATADMRVLLTGGSGFIAAHVLDILLDHGHSVVTTVRSQDKADRIAKAHPKHDKSQLDFAIVEDIAKEGAFDQAVVSDPPFEAVIHTASPFHFNVTDVQKQLLDPAYIGTTGILKSIKKSAPTVKRVIITSSFASIINPSKGTNVGHTYSEKDWNPITHEEALESPAAGYRASKVFAEKAAWEFVEEEKPNFSLSTMCPPLVLGPIVHYLNSLDALNTSNQRIRDTMLGKYKDEIPETGIYIWVDVRDLALAHVLAVEKAEAANKRFFITEGYFTNRKIAESIAKSYPELKDKLPTDKAKGGDFPKEGIYGIDNSRTKDVLGIKYRSFDESIRDTVKSLQAVGG